MKYRSNKHGDFVVVDGRSYKVERRYYNDAESCAPSLVEEMFEHLGMRKIALKILTVGDQPFILGSFPMEGDDDHCVQLSEVRQDARGMAFKKKPPFLKAESHMPLITFVGGMGEVQVNSFVGNDVLGSVALIVQQGINETLQDNVQKHNAPPPGSQPIVG
jgi:hypothetical protein